MNKTLERFFEHPAKGKADARRQAAAEALLEPGERIQASFYASTLPWWGVVLTTAGVAAMHLFRDRGETTLLQLLALLSSVVVVLGLATLARYLRRIVIVTNTRILVCGAGPHLELGPLLREVARDIELSQPSGKWGRFDQLGDYLWVSKRHRQDLADADAALAATRVLR